MRARWWLALSLALNVVLVSYWYKDVPILNNESIIIRQKETVTVPGPVRTVPIVRRQFFNWSEIESDDYATFIANLRRIGCPEVTVRDIIIADVNQVFAQRRATEIVPADSEWWKSEPDLDRTEVALDKMGALEKERVALLTKLLGPNWNVNFDKATEPGTVALNGPVLGAMSPESKLKVQELAANSARRVKDYVEAQRTAGKAIDAAELAKFRGDHRQELTKLLSPTELEEYLLRYSANAETLRNQLKGFSPTPDEFRAIFRARDQIDNEIQLHYSGTDPAAVKARAELERRREDAVTAALGPERAGLYKATGDPLFRQAQTLAEQNGADAEKVMPLYEVQLETAKERARINADTTLSAAQRATALKQIQADEESARRKILGLPAEEQTE